MSRVDSLIRPRFYLRFVCNCVSFLHRCFKSIIPKRLLNGAINIIQCKYTKNILNTQTTPRTPTLTQ